MVAREEGTYTPGTCAVYANVNILRVLVLRHRETSQTACSEHSEVAFVHRVAMVAIVTITNFELERLWHDLSVDGLKYSLTNICRIPAGKPCKRAI